MRDESLTGTFHLEHFLFINSLNICVMKKCKITVVKTYPSGKKELKTSHSLELDEDRLAELCGRVIDALYVDEDGDLRRLYDMLRAY